MWINFVDNFWFEFFFFFFFLGGGGWRGGEGGGVGYDPQNYGAVKRDCGVDSAENH